MTADSAESTAYQSRLAAGEAAERAGDLLSAAAAYREISESSVPEEAAEGHFRLGVVEWRRSRFDDALAAFAATRDLAQRIGRRDLEARAWNGEGTIHCQRGEFQQARAAYQVAMGVTDDPVLHGRSLQNLGVLANIEGNLADALQQYARARRVFREHGDHASEALVLHNMGMLHADRAEWDEADDSYNQALALFETDGNQPMIANTLANRSEVLSARGRFDEAVQQCRMAVSIYTELGDDVGRGETLRWQGRALRGAGDIAQAEVILHQALQISTHYRIKLLEAEVSRELFEIMLTSHRNAEAVTWRERALALFTELGATREISALQSRAGDRAPRNA
jgi:tetratricopeptide (TPR) repeat protein